MLKKTKNKPLPKTFKLTHVAVNGGYLSKIHNKELKDHNCNWDVLNDISDIMNL